MAPPIQSNYLIKMAGEEGFEPSNAGIKIRCLNQLGDSPAGKNGARASRNAHSAPLGTRCLGSWEGRKRMSRQRAGDERAHAGWRGQDGVARQLARCK